MKKKIAQLEQRIKQNVKTQEGDEAGESVSELIAEHGELVNDLQIIISRINKTNVLTEVRGYSSIEQMISLCNRLKTNISAYRDFYDAATIKHTSFMRSEIKFVRQVDLKALQNCINGWSKTLREYDSSIQQANWNTDLLEL
jgi:chemotaxis methyl-accepting protein methylase